MTATQSRAVAFKFLYPETFKGGLKWDLEIEIPKNPEPPIRLIEMKNNDSADARAATLDELIKNVIPLFISPVPSRDTLRNWFDAANLPRFKSNPNAKRGGGPCYYSVAAVEKLLKARFQRS